MTKNTINSLDRSASVIAMHLAPAVMMQKKTAVKAKQSFRDEIRQTLSCKENRRFIQMDMEMKVENVCKSKEQLDYLTDQVISRLDEMHVPHN